MIPRIKSVKPLKGYMLHVVFDDGKDCIYDVNDDINEIEGYQDLKTINGLFEQVQLDESQTCVFWNDYIDLPSDAIYENALINHIDRAIYESEQEIANGAEAVDADVVFAELDKKVKQYML